MTCFAGFSLAVAAEAGHGGAVALLLAHNADASVIAPGRLRHTPLHVAAQRGHAAVALRTRMKNIE